MPAGVKQDLFKLGSVPFGGNGHWGIYVSNWSEFEVKEDSKITTQYLKNIKFPKNALIGGVTRKDKSLIPNGGFRIRKGDRVVVLCGKEVIHNVEEFFK